MQVHYVFEDNSTSLLSQLFRKAEEVAMLHLYRYGIDRVDNVKHNIDEVDP